MRRSRVLLWFPLFLGVAVCAGMPAQSAPVPDSATPPARQQTPSFSQEGIASWYGQAKGNKTTANGERVRAGALTAANRSLPFNTVARVTNLDTGKSVKVRINDRGPFAGGRIIDLSRAAAARLGMIKQRLAKVRVEVFAADQTFRRSLRRSVLAVSGRGRSRRPGRAKTVRGDG